MGLTRILPHLTVFALQLFLRTACLLSIIVASASLIGTKKTIVTFCNLSYRVTNCVAGAAIAMLLVPDLTGLPMKE